MVSVADYISQFTELAKRHGFDEVDVKAQGTHQCSIRVACSSDLFLDTYCNMLTSRKDFALIRNGKRIFGIDNYQGWHVHTLENPSRHEPCSELTLEEIFEHVDRAVKSIRP